MQSCPEEVKPKLWYRYVDDILEVAKKDKVIELTDHLNSITPSIQFTVKVEDSDPKDHKHLPVFDLDIKRSEDGSTKFSVYQKTTHTDQYLNFSSHHPIHQKLGVIRTLYDRAVSLTTSEEDKKAELKKINGALRLCGYLDWTFEKVLKQINNRDDNKKKKKKDQAQKDEKKPANKLVILPYIKEFTEKAARVFRKYNRSVAMKPTNTLGQSLFKLKDNSKKADCIYKIECNDCEACYIGESSSPLYVRLEEHQTESDKVSQKHFTQARKESESTTTKKSAIAEHVARTNHSINWSEASAIEHNYTMRGIKEAIHIRSTPGNMNCPSGERLPHL